MAITIHFTPNLARHVECPTLTARGKTVREALDSAFAQNPKVRDFVVDEHGVLRKHMNVRGYQRDTVYFSILDNEWPAVKGRLQARLAAGPITSGR